MELPDSQVPATVSSKIPARLGRACATLIKIALKHGISLSRGVSERLAEHEGRMLSEVAVKELFVEEGKVAANLKKDLMLEAARATDSLQRAQLMSTLDDVDARIRTVSILNQTLPYINAVENEKSQRENDSDADLGQPSEQWLDTFLQFARMRNEAWRQDLLARLLAIEAVTPGGMSPQVIWTIGQLSEETFHCYAYILDVAAFDGKSDEESFLFPYMIDELGIMDREIANFIPNPSLKGRKRYGQLFPPLQEANLIYPAIPNSGVGRTFTKGKATIFRYGEELVQGKWLEDYRFAGILPTALGESVARLYEPKPSQFGHDMFHKWIQSISHVFELIPNKTS